MMVTGSGFTPRAWPTRGSGRALRATDRFRAASITKSFVATVALQLVGEGKLSLSDTVERRLPGILPYGDRITLRQLLNHTSGVPQDGGVGRRARAVHGRRDPDPGRRASSSRSSPTRTPDFAAG